MLYSTTTAAKILEIARGGADISVDVSDEEMLLWLNAMEQRLYSEIVREERMASIEEPEKDERITLSTIAHNEDEDAVSARDIVSVEADGAELERVSGGGGLIWHVGERPAWYDDGVSITISLDRKPEELKIAYVVRPALFTMENKDTAFVHMVPEFLPMMVSRLRGELYRMANEDGLAAKWLSDYNQELNTFVEWAARHFGRYGV